MEVEEVAEMEVVEEAVVADLSVYIQVDTSPMDSRSVTFKQSCI